jgi:hypothetical protein
LHKSGALARHAAPAVVLIGRVGGLQDGLHPFTGLPGNLGGVAVVHDHLPCGWGQPALSGVGTARRRRACFPVHQGASVGWMAQDGTHRGDGRSAPDGLAGAVAAGPPQARLPLEAALVADRLPRQDHLEHSGQGVLHRHLRSVDHAAILLTEQA